MFEGLTNKGKEYMAKCLAENKPVSFAKVKIGDGTIGHGENPETFIDIKSIKKEVSIVDKTQIGDTAKLTVQLDNTGVLEGYFPREIGIYVQDGGQEILYWYINDGSETSWLPPASKSPVKFKYHINLMVTNLETVIVNWSGKELWVDREYLGKELDKKLNNGNLPSIVTNAETIFKALQGNTGMKFDENLLYLNDSGTKKKGYCYIDKLTDGIFECIQETTTTVNNATYFKNFSNKENSDRLSNLIENREIIFYKGGSIIPVGSKAKFTRKKYMIIRFADNFIPICDFSEFNQNNNVFSFNGVILKFNFELFEVEVISNENKLVSLYLLDNVVL